MLEMIILLLLIFLNGLFVMAEIALVSARKSRLENLAENGDDRARRALKLAENPELFLSTAQIGITLIAILTGFYSGEKFSAQLQPYLEQVPFLRHYAANLSTALILVIVTLLSIIFGELIPKRIGLLRAEQIARLVAGPVRTLSLITYPIVWLLNKTSNLFFSIVNLKPSSDSAVTEDEIKAIINEGTEQGAIDEAEQEIIERVFHLGDRNITSLMTHRSDIIWFDLNDNEETIKEKIIREPHSVYPICDGEIDHIKGVVSIKDLYVTDDTVLFKDIMSPPLFVPENNTAYMVLEKFKQSKIHCCFIVDEYGSLLGLITLNDILEAIIGGEITQPDVADYEIKKRDDGGWLVDAQIPFYDFLSHFHKTEWMNEGDHDFDTLAGFILNRLEHIPSSGEKLEWRGFTFEIIDMDAQRIDKVLVNTSEKLEKEIEEEEEE
ncbi:MAG: HlyC/CorC family transporter [Bacteroidetes bacterium]|nr:HlyC/CorC family transporter [Bacteroidota bacterium]